MIFIPSSSTMIPMAKLGKPIIKPEVNREGGTLSAISKLSVGSAIGSSVIGILVNDVMAPGRKVTLLTVESKSTPFPIIPLYT